jgi:hypothetical protein
VAVAATATRDHHHAVAAHWCTSPSPGPAINTGQFEARVVCTHRFIAPDHKKNRSPRRAQKVLKEQHQMSDTQNWDALSDKFRQEFEHKIDHLSWKIETQEVRDYLYYLSNQFNKSNQINQISSKQYYF